mmetsp:Transcript_58396/g.169095  ORF Transcript_58396/g.169095 Transcript_58396/m.169095 type:complete len:253 (+) Transcript_58396:674-1432(+)
MLARDPQVPLVVRFPADPTLVVLVVLEGRRHAVVCRDIERLRDQNRSSPADAQQTVAITIGALNLPLLDNLMVLRVPSAGEEVVDLAPPLVVAVEVEPPAPSHAQEVDEAAIARIDLLRRRARMRPHGETNESAPGVLWHPREYIEQGGNREATCVTASAVATAARAAVRVGAAGVAVARRVPEGVVGVGARPVDRVLQRQGCRIATAEAVRTAAAIRAARARAIAQPARAAVAPARATAGARQCHAACGQA